MDELGEHRGILRAVLDLDRYFERIGYGGPSTPSLVTLAAILRAHMTSVPFENLDVLMRVPISLDPDALFDKLVARRRGGYCYEHASLMQAVLVRLGFAVTAHAARVTMVGAKATSPRTHMLLSVDLPEGAFAIDPGFGSLAPLEPVPLDGTRTLAGTHWIEHDAGEYTLEADTPAGLVHAWVTTMTPEYPIDFVLANHYTESHPQSAFTQRLMMRMFRDDGDRVTVMNREVTRRSGDAESTSELADRAALRDLLVADFGIDLDVGTLRVPMIPEWSS
jgi:N-hydroxyarylamine O-acetyltransferase